jgi:hypothetical protein
MAQTDLLTALQQLLGPANDPLIGWRGFAKTSNDHFACEFCRVEDLDCVDLQHASDCPITAARAAIATATATGSEA